MKNKTIISIAVATMISCPAFATGIGASDTTADCDNSTLGTYEGSMNLQAQWTANRITLNWYNDSTENNGSAINVTGTNAASCEYDGGITLPSNPSKTGYNFAGWRVRTAAAPSQPQQTTFDLSTLNANTDGIDYSSKNFAGDYCYYYNEDTGDEIDSETCNESAFSDLSTGEWKASFSYGTVKGEAYCSGKSGNNHSWQWGGNSADWSATEIELTSASGEAKYCWCKATGFAEPNSSNYQNVSSSSWVFDYDLGDADYCAYNCAGDCANYVYYYAVFRRAVFGVTQ